MPLALKVCFTRTLAEAEYLRMFDPTDARNFPIMDKIPGVPLQNRLVFCTTPQTILLLELKVSTKLSLIS
jgi:hypothetical protein